MNKLVIMAGVVAVWAMTSFGGILYVTPEGGGTKDGSSWANAFASPSAALAAANAGDEVRFASGTYALAAGLSLTGKDNMTLTGSWNPATDVRDDVARTTVLEPTDDCLDVLLTIDACVGTTLKGIRFRKAFHLSDAGITYGGAVCAKTSMDLMLENCDFHENHVYCTASWKYVNNVEGTSNWGVGGGLACVSCTNLVAKGCDFRGNVAEGRYTVTGNNNGRAAGGAVALVETTASFEDCVFVGNRAVAWLNNDWQTTDLNYYSWGGALANIERLGRKEGAASNDFDAHPSYNNGGCKDVTMENCLLAANAATRLGTRAANDQNHLSPAGFYALRAGQPLGLLQTYIRKTDNGESPDDPSHHGGAVYGGRITMTKCTMVANQGNAFYSCNHWISMLTADRCLFRNACMDVKRVDSGGSGFGYVKITDSFVLEGSEDNYQPSKTTGTTFGDPQFVWGMKPTAADAEGKGYVPVAGWPLERRVLYVSPSGSDSAAGTEAAPLKSITKALELATDMTLVRLAAGTYSASATGEVFPLRLFAKVGVTIEGAGEDKTFVDGEKKSGRRLMEVIACAAPRLEKFTLRNARFDEVMQDVYVGCPDYDLKAGAGLLVAMSQAVELSHVACRDNVLKNDSSKAFNTSMSGAGAHFNGSSFHAADCAFDGNDIAISPDSYNCTSMNGGSGLSAYVCLGSFDRCSICDNTFSSTGIGGGIYAVGALVGHRLGRLKAMGTSFRNCLFARNRYTARDKPKGTVEGQLSLNPPMALFVDGNAVPNVSVTVENCTFADNDYAAKTEDWQQNALNVQARYGTFKNCVFWGGEKDIFMNKDDYATLTLSLVNCLVQHYAGTAQTACITGGADPFKRSGKSPYCLRNCSSAIDAGTGDVTYATADDLDFANLPRLQFSAIDIGCYEFQPPQGMMLICR